MRMRNVAVGLVMVLGGISMSCAPRDVGASADEQAIRAMYDRFSAAVASKDLGAIMSMYVPDDRLVAFDAFPPRQYVGAAAYRKDYEQFFVEFPGPATSQMSDVHVEAAGPLAFAHAFWLDIKSITIIP